MDYQLSIKCLNSFSQIIINYYYFNSSRIISINKFYRFLKDSFIIITYITQCRLTEMVNSRKYIIPLYWQLLYYLIGCRSVQQPVCTSTQHAECCIGYIQTCSLICVTSSLLYIWRHTVTHTMYMCKCIHACRDIWTDKVTWFVLPSVAFSLNVVKFKVRSSTETAEML